jgi:uncharacterized RDD family membrane protein YckC
LVSVAGLIGIDYAASVKLLQVLMVVCVWLASTLSAEPADLPVAGGDGHLWVLQPIPGEARQSLLLHRGPADPPGSLRVARRVTGAAGAAGMASTGTELWLVFNDGSVRRFRAEAQQGGQPGFTVASSVEASLPRGARVRMAAANESGLWALVRLEGAIDVAPPPDPRMLGPEGERQALWNMALGLPPGYAWGPPAPPGEAAAAAADDADHEGEAIAPDARPDAPAVERDGAGAWPEDGRREPPTIGPRIDPGLPPESRDPPTDPVPLQGGTLPDAAAMPPVEAEDAPVIPERDVLLRLFGGRWSPVELPRDWPDDAAGRMVIRRGDSRPTLIAYEPLGDATAVRLHRPTRDEGWSVASLVIEGAGPLAATVVQSELVLVQGEPQAPPIESTVWVVRGSEAARVGSMRIDAEPPAPWGVAPLGLTVALVGQTAPPEPPAEPTSPWDVLAGPPPLHLASSRMDLTGTLVQPAQPLELHSPGRWLQVFDMLGLLIIVGLTVAMVKVLWKRDPQTNRVDLPSDTVIADLGRRALAGLIDLMPIVFVVMQWYSLGLMELLGDHWPGRRVAAIDAMIPGAIAIGVFVLHTTLGELFFGRSLGKAFTGLRVTDMQGRPAAGWRVLLRCVLKAVDLVTPLLLILPLIGPFRQRLGDVLARTVVVMARPEDERPEDEDDADERSDDDQPGKQDDASDDA